MAFNEDDYTSVLYDDFNDNSATPTISAVRWQNRRHWTADLATDTRPFGGATSFFDVVNGVWTFETEKLEGYGSGSSAGVVTPFVTAAGVSFRIDVDYTTGWLAGIDIGSSRVDSTRFAVELYLPAESPYTPVVFYNEDEGPSTVIDPDLLQAYVRFILADGNVYLQTGPDGTTWTTLASHPFEGASSKIRFHNYFAAVGAFDAGVYTSEIDDVTFWYPKSITQPFIEVEPNPPIVTEFQGIPTGTSTWRALYGSFKTLTPEGELPFTSLSFTETLNEVGSLTATIPLDVNIAYEALQPGRTFVALLRDDAPVDLYVITGATFDVAANTASLAGVSYLGYLDRQIIETDVTYTAQDQTSVIAYGLTGLDTGAPNASGKTRDRTYLLNEFKPRGEALRQLANVEDGFDFWFDPTYANGMFTIDFNTYYPNTGRPTGLVFELGTNLFNVTAQASTENLASTVYVSLAGQGDTPTVIKRTHVDANTVPYTRTIAFSDDRSVTNATDHAERMLTAGKTPNIQITADIDMKNPAGYYGSFRTGDRARLRVDYGTFNIDDTYIITSITTNVDDDEKASITLAPLGGFA